MQNLKTVDSRFYANLAFVRRVFGVRLLKKILKTAG